MEAIVIGCGKVGSLLATLLAEHGDDVVVVDPNPSAFEKLGSGFNGDSHLGTGIDVDVLRAAGAETADALVAVTSNDNVNIAVAQVAEEIFHVPMILCRVHDVLREEIYREHGLQTISPTRLAAQQMMRRLLAGTTLVDGLPSGYRWRDVTAAARIAGKTVEEAEEIVGGRILFVYRGNRQLLATASLRIVEADVLATVCRVETAKLPPGGGPA